MAMTNNPAALQTAYTLSLLGEYTHTLDTLPLDLSRHFADLRELDAVLSASMYAITSKVNRLIDMIEHNSAPKEERLWLLADIAEEAQRLKLGGEDKIRVACQAADGLQNHHEHLTALLSRVPNFDTTVLSRRTVYPHVAARSYAPPSMYESGRRRRGALLTTTAADQPTPAKRKRGVRDDESDIVANGRSPRKNKDADAPTSQRNKNGNRSKKTNRAASPTESLLSVTSHQQPFPAQPAPSGSRGTTRNPATTKRSRAPAASPIDPPKDLLPGPPATSHPSLPSPYASTLPPVPGTAWSGPMHTQLEGPGMPIARALGPPATALVGPGVDPSAQTDGGEPGEGEAEGDDGRVYCWCNMPSYGEMIACDGEGCEREWFHVGCLKLEMLPTGTWFCDACQSKQKAKRSSRGGKRRSGGGGRSGARAQTASSAA